MPLCASLRLRQVFRRFPDCAKADMPAQAGCTPSMAVITRLAIRTAIIPDFPLPAYGLSANGRNLRKRHAPTTDPGIRLRTGHRRRRTERLTRRPSAHRNNCRILPPSGIACRAPYASARAKRNGTRSCHERSGAAHRPPSAGSRERGPSASRTGTRITFRTPSRPRVPRGKPDGSEAWSRHKARTPPKESAA